MDFEKVLPLIIGEFSRKKVRYGLMGGFAMGAMGIMRSTMDLDFLVDARDIPKIEKIMKKYDYKCAYKSENVSQYVGAVKIFGEIDFLYAFRKISLSMFSRAKDMMIFGGKARIKVLSPEDVIGLKLQALSNESSRENREYADIESIMEHFGKKLDWKLIGEYFGLFEKKEKLKEFKVKYGKAN